ncbi:MAG: hypothetical protein AABW80_00825 [Nanoarchaeota archaeon]
MKRVNKKGLSDTRERVSLVSKRAIGKKALSDVVATVLIIFLVVAAVVAIWAFINPTLKSAGTGIQRGQVCLTSTVEPITCKYSGNTTYVGNNVPALSRLNYTIGYRANYDANSVSSIQGVQITVELEDGTVASGNGDKAIKNGASNSTQVPVAVKNAKQVTIAAEFLLPDGQKQTCNSVPLPCDIN